MGIAKKKQLLKDKILKGHGGNKTKCMAVFKLMDLMEEANIPVGYWFLKMGNFSGSPIIKDIVNVYIENIKNNYIEGKSICLAGNQGTGKTMSSVCIAKEAIKNGFSAYYITASDMLAEIVNYNKNTNIRQVLRDVDFLIIDEVDTRFFASDAQKELFSGIYENIFRHRSHNLLPTIICTNETDDILNVFYGYAKKAISSLYNQYLDIHYAVGKDFRKGK